MPSNEAAEEIAMDKDRIAGAAKQAVGGIKQAAGKAVGDKKLETEGAAQKPDGAVQNTVGVRRSLRPRLTFAGAWTILRTLPRPRGRDRRRSAPKEQPPRKLSGKRTAGAWLLWKAG
jgi:uncharacterized protein YjbJ (UPF0337 family)